MITSNKELIEFLVKHGYLKTPKIIEAFNYVNRADFVPSDFLPHAYQNIPIQIGAGQTISQPIVVAFMLELLSPKEGEVILDIGSGSGWTTALLAYCVGEKGKVYGVERIESICKFGQRNLEKYPDLNKRVRILCQDGSKGLKEIADRERGFDKILTGASAQEVPKEWIAQLKDGGIIVAPIKHSIVYLKKEKEKIIKRDFFGFSFVPLIEEK